MLSFCLYVSADGSFILAEILPSLLSRLVYHFDPDKNKEMD